MNGRSNGDFSFSIDEPWGSLGDTEFCLTPIPGQSMSPSEHTSQQPARSPSEHTAYDSASPQAMANDSDALGSFRKECALEFSYPSVSALQLTLKRAAQVICDRHLLVRQAGAVAKKRVLAAVPESLVLNSDNGLFTLPFGEGALPEMPKASMEAFPYGTLQAEFALNMIDKLARLDPVFDGSACLRCCECNQSCTETSFLLTIDHQPQPQGARCRGDLDLEVHGRDDTSVQLPPNPFVSVVNGATGEREGNAVCIGCLWSRWMLPKAASVPVLGSPFGLTETIVALETEIGADQSQLCRFLSDVTGAAFCAMQFSYVTQDYQVWVTQRANTNATIALASGSNLWKTHEAEPTAPPVEAINDAVRQRLGKRKRKIAFDRDTEDEHRQQKTIRTVVDTIWNITPPYAPNGTSGQAQEGTPPNLHPDFLLSAPPPQERQETKPPDWKTARKFLVSAKEFIQARGGIVIPLPPDIPSILYVCTFCGQPGHQNGRTCPMMHRSIKPPEKMSDPFGKHLDTYLQKYAVDDGEWATHSTTFVDVAIGLIDGVIAAIRVESDRDNDSNAPRSMDYLNETGRMLERQLKVTDKDSHWYDENQPYECLRIRNIRQCKDRDRPIYATAWCTVPRAYLIDVAHCTEARPCDLLDMTSFTTKSEIVAAATTLQKHQWDVTHIHDMIEVFDKPSVILINTEPTEQISIFDAFELVQKRVRDFITSTADNALQADLPNLSKKASELTAMRYRNRKTPRTGPRKGTRTKADPKKKLLQETPGLKQYMEHVERAENSAYIRTLIAARDEVFDNIIYHLFEAHERVSERSLAFPELGSTAYHDGKRNFTVHLQDVHMVAGQKTSHELLFPGLSDGIL